MQGLLRYFCSTIGRKQLTGVTGLGLSLFVLTHCLANVLILFSPEAYNMYGHNLTSNPVIYLAEAGLIVLFVLHLGLALKLTYENHLARGHGYKVQASGDKATSLITKTMWHQGIIIGGFVILHLLTFKFGEVYEITYGDLVVRDLHRLVVEVFASPVYTAGYVISVTVLGFHLSHGVSSALQTLGINHPQYTPIFKKIGIFYGAIIAVTFAAQPLYVFFCKG